MIKHPNYFEAPNYPKNKINQKSIFLGGGISDCADWQTPVANAILENTDLVVFNPRRTDFDIKDPNASKVQITWEFHLLRIADELIFWFPKTSVCPITLFEYGKWLGKKKIYVGCEPGYSRQLDIEIQSMLELSKPIEIYSSIDDLCTAIISSNK